MTLSKQERKDVVERLVEEAFTGANADSLEEFMSADVTVHGNTEHDGLGAFEEFMRAMSSTFPDIEFALERVVADGETVAFRTTVTGTHEGEFQGLPPTGNEFEYTATWFAEFEDGQIAHVDYDADRVAMLEDLGVMD